MKWTRRFAVRTEQMRPSVIRELLKVTANPDIISFAGGLPAPELFPVDAFRAATDAVLSRYGVRALQYGETAGVAELREWLAQRYSTDRRPMTSSNLVITSGAQQGLDLLGRVLLDPGAQVMVENPTYLALLSAWRPLGVQFRGIPGDDEGLRVDLLSASVERPGTLLYTIPNFQNPQGTTLVEGRRQELVRLAQERGLGIIEDDPYGELRFDGDPVPSLFDLDAPLDGSSHGEWNVIQTGTFSKVLAPGLRLGWVLAPEPVIEKLVLAKQSTDLHTSTLTQWIALELLRRGILEVQIPRLCAEYRDRRDAMLTALERYAPCGVTWTRPAGGMFLWVTLPPDLDTAVLLPRALERQIAYVPGEAFHLDGEGRNTLRLNFSNTSSPLIEEGIRRLGALFDAAIR